MGERALRIAILTCSDTRPLAEDSAGTALAELCRARGWEVVAHRVVPDDRSRIAETIVEYADDLAADTVFTCGGTGLSLRDVTPEATLDVCDRVAPGIVEAMRAESMRITRRAMLSRATAALRGRTLVINLPGSEKAARETFGFVADQLEHAAEMIAGGGHA
ncbi:MAG: MogA/MoaB family molybdenum cofactor biosynthesis protein [Clostridiales bacterium]|nr:MogA/MoaB family molybdenum cofactor biosynthesis protein [Clostridiales bacterium]